MSEVFIPKKLVTKLKGKKMMVTIVKIKIALLFDSALNDIACAACFPRQLDFHEYVYHRLPGSTVKVEGILTKL